MYSSAHVTNSLHDPSIIQQRNTGAISRDSYRTSRNLRQSDVDRISNFEFAHVVSNFCDCTSTVITNLIRETIFVTIVICLAREYTYESLSANLRAPSAFLTSIGLILAA